MKCKLISLMIFLLLAAALLPCYAQETPQPEIRDVSLELLGSSVHYPQLTGLADAQLQAEINNAIMEEGRINERLSRMAALLNAPVKLSVSYSCTLTGDVFSCAMLADGAVETSRATQVWSAVNYNLRTGEKITYADLFTDEAAARAAMEAYLQEQVAPELSAHLAAGSLTPIPENFAISPTGLTLLYGIGSFRTLSDRAGTVTILWSELQEHLRLAEGDVLHSLGVPGNLTLAEDAAVQIAKALENSAFPGIPAALDQPVQELIDRHALLTDPDLYEGGRMLALEDGAFRSTWLLTDAVTRTFDASVVQGIRADRLCFRGLCTGITTMNEWRNVLGKPEITVSLDEARAEGYRLVPGTSDYYTFGNCRLRLHADESGVLRSVFLTR